MLRLTTHNSRPTTYKTGILIVNLGTPDAPTRSAVYRYLKQFLLDPRVIDINPIARNLLVRGIIAPFRSGKSAEAYKHLWTENGSPLKFYGENLVAQVQQLLGPEYVVELAMRYQNPPIESAIGKLMQAKVSKIKVFTLFPQYASATTGSVHEEVMRVLAKQQIIPALEFVSQYATWQPMIDLFVKNALKYDLSHYDHFLFSYHGLPQRLPGGHDGGAATGRLDEHRGVVIGAIGGGKGHRDRGEIDFQFLGDQHGQRRQHALPHFRAPHQQGDRVVRVDADPRIRREAALSVDGGFRTAAGQLQAQHQRAAGRGRELQEMATVEIDRRAHGSFLTHRDRSPPDGLPDARVGAAAADIAGHGLIDLGIAGIRVAGEQGHRRHDLTRLAIAALGHVHLQPDALDRVQIGAGQPLDGRYLLSCDRRERCDAGTDGHAV